MSGPQNEGVVSGFRADCERIFREWHYRARALDTEGLLALYSEDAVLESLLVPAILDDKQDGVLRGHDELRRFFDEGGRRRPNELVRWCRTGEWLTDGRRILVWEYPRAGAGRRSGRPCRIHGDRGRTDRLPPRLLGVERLQVDCARAFPTLIIANHSSHIRSWPGLPEAGNRRPFRSAGPARHHLLQSRWLSHPKRSSRRNCVIPARQAGSSLPPFPYGQSRLHPPQLRAQNDLCRIKPPRIGAASNRALQRIRRSVDPFGLKRDR